MKFTLFVALSTLVVLVCPLVEAFICPHETGYFRHPTDPHRFIYCINGRDYEYVCPSGLVWNQSVHQCDYTTGPADTTERTVTPPHGTRKRHTDEPTTYTTEVSSLQPEGSTRGRHH
ncbi:hypothetical protein TYRP_017707 [Tyrophagus putrescentiae]|nr:hypothetical protein TYRP_017707 [Tyrophagus putrescentiae]